MLETDSIVCSVSICVALVRFQFMKIVVQQISFNLSFSQRKTQATRLKKSFTVDLSSFRLTVRMFRRIVLKMFRNSSDLMST